MMLKKLPLFGLMLMLGLTLLYYSPFYYFSPEQKASRAMDKLIKRNIDARGGASAWESVSSLRLTGLMDVGQGMHLPYVLEQKRPGKMCLEFVFDGETAVQCTDGNTGWKLVPFRGSTRPESMTQAELRETADSADLYGLLFDYGDRGHVVEIMGREQVKGRDAIKLKVTLPKGTVRWVYLDAETALEVKVEALRKIAGRERRVETFYYDWQAAGGLLIAGRQETQTEGDKEWHFLTIESIQVNPTLDDARFKMPAVVTAIAGQGK